MYVEPEPNWGVGSKWGRKLELDQTFFPKSGFGSLFRVRVWASTSFNF